VSDAGTSVFTPIVPSGEVITAVQSERLEGAAVPEQPASADAKSRDAQRKRDLADIQKAFEQYKSDTGAYPSVSAETQLGSSATLFNALVPKYLTKMPVDPLNSTYYYTYNITSTGYVLRSILEDHSDTMGVTGQTYHYYQVTNK
jgi:type II secretory pathway pseudopilin PulG